MATLRRETRVVCLGQTKHLSTSDEHVELRARQEGVAGSQVCPRSFGRQLTESDSVIHADDLLGDDEQIKASKVIKHGRFKSKAVDWVSLAVANGKTNCW